MKGKREKGESRFFSIAFGIMITSIGLVWFLQTIGILSEGIRVLQYVCPLCVILFGLRIITEHIVTENNIKHEIRGGYNGRM